MSKDRKSFNIEIEESISSALSRAYGKTYSGKYSFNEDLGKWVSENEANTCIEFLSDKKCFRLYDEELDLQIDASREASIEDDPIKLSWGKLKVIEGRGKNEEKLPEFRFQAVGDAPPASPTTTVSLSAYPTPTESQSMPTSPTTTVSLSAYPTPTGTESVSASPTTTVSFSPASPTETPSRIIPTPSFTASPTSTKTCESVPYATTGPSSDFLGPYYPSGQNSSGYTNWTNGTKWITWIGGRWSFRNTSAYDAAYVGTPWGYQYTNPNLVNYLELGGTTGGYSVSMEEVCPTPSDTATGPTPSCTDYPVYDLSDMDSPENCPDCWEECTELSECPCDCPHVASPTSTLVITPTSSATPSESVSSTPSLTCSSNLTWRETPVTSGELGDDKEWCPIDYSESLRYVEISSNGSDFAPLKYVTHLNYCTFYKLRFSGKNNKSGFKIKEDPDELWPTKAPYFNCQEGRPFGPIAAGKGSIEFSIQPNNSSPLGKPTFISWEYIIPSDVLSELQAANKNGSSQSRALDDSEYIAKASHNSTNYRNHPSEGDIYCFNGTKYKYTGGDCACPTPSSSESQSFSASPTETPSHPSAAYPTPSSTPTASYTPSASTSPSCTVSDDGVRKGWFFISDMGCRGLSEKTQSEIVDQSIDKSKYNERTSVIDLGRWNKAGEVDKESRSWGCGGYCLYEWRVNSQITKRTDAQVCLDPISAVTGPYKHCNYKPLILNVWVSSDNIGDCVSIDTNEIYSMSYFSYDPMSIVQCGCDPASACPDWSKPAPSHPPKSWLPICPAELEVDSVPPSTPTITASVITRKFKYLIQNDDGNTGVSEYYVELLVDSEGWPIELKFPAGAYVNGELDPFSEDYQRAIRAFVPPYEYLTVIWWDFDGKSWTRNGYFYPVN